MRCDERTQSIRIFGVNPDKTEEEVKAVLNQFGEVKGSLVKGRIPGFDNKVSDGSVSGRMVLERRDELPPFIKFEEEGEIWKITSDMIPNCCWKCSESGHLGWQCKAAQPASTWADVANNRRGRQDPQVQRRQDQQGQRGGREKQRKAEER